MPSGVTTLERMGRPRLPLTREQRKTPAGRFALHLDKLMQERGWSVREVAERSGFSESRIRSWLRAAYMPETPDLQTLGESFDLDDYRFILPPA